MGKFGWSLPPGVTNRMIDEAYGTDEPCEICGQNPDGDCLCPECPECGGVGDPGCYDKHGLVRTQEQIDSLRTAEDDWKAENEAEAEYWKEKSKGRADSIFDEE